MYVCMYVCVYLFETEFLCVALIILELALQTTLASNLEICLSLPPSAGVKGMRHFCLARVYIYFTDKLSDNNKIELRNR